jgi:hypothetical protein
MSIFGGFMPDAHDAYQYEVEGEEADPIVYRYQLSPSFSFGDGSQIGYLSGSGQAITMTSEQASLMAWIEKALRTPRDTYVIYGPEYGTDFAKRLGNLSFQELRSSITSDVRRCLLVHPLITKVSAVQLSRLSYDAAALSFVVTDRINGETQVEVTLEDML